MRRSIHLVHKSDLSPLFLSFESLQFTEKVSVNRKLTFYVMVLDTEI